MKKMLSVMAVVLACGAARAALPPQYQNAKDLDVMVRFIGQHDRVAASLRTIDVVNFVVHYGDGCQAVFGRRVIPKAQGWAGPADPLEFKRSNCPLDH